MTATAKAASPAASDGSPDLIVVGGGPGGYVAAIRAAQLGLKVTVVEREHLGGICANWGCIPTKALLHSAELFFELRRHGADHGVLADNLRFDYRKAIAHSRAVADNQQKGVGLLFKKNKIDWVRATATVKRAATGLELALDNGQTLRGRHVMLATGARPRVLPGIEPDKRQILTYFEAMNLEAQPASLVIVGAGAIGVEFAYFYNAIGTQVTLIEALPQILPVEDKEIAQVLEKSLRGQGITVHTGAKVAEVKKEPSEVLVRFTDASGKTQELRAERLLSAVGVRGNSDGLGLEALGVRIDRTFVAVDDAYRVLDGAGEPLAGLYAIGDLIGGPLLAHKASAEAISCVEQLAGVPAREVRRVDLSTMPGATFCKPEVGSMGLTEEKARQAGRDVQVGRFPFRASGKAQATGATEGLVKVVTDKKTGEILGAHIVGGTASDMIATLTLARASELTVTEVLHTVFAHPTYAEVVKGSVEAALGEAIDL